MTGRNALTDVMGLAVGNAQDPEVATGVTIVLAEEPAVCAVDVRGGGPGTRETDALALSGLVDRVDAVVLSGGSVFGLAAADAVVTDLALQGRGFGLMDLPGVPRSPIVPSAILYDLANGGNKAWGRQPPYRELGHRAFAARARDFELGRAGAGMGAMAGSLPGGLGSTSAEVAGGTVGALVAVNCFGSVVMPGSDVYWGWALEQGAEAGGRTPLPGTAPPAPEDWGPAKVNPAALARANTTLAVVATDFALTKPQAQRMATMASAGLARAIRPVFAPFDGDVVFAMSTATIPLPEPIDLLLAQIGSTAADVLTRAVMRGVEASKMC